MQSVVDELELVDELGSHVLFILKAGHGDRPLMDGQTEDGEVSMGRDLVACYTSYPARPKTPDVQVSNLLAGLPPAGLLLKNHNGFHYSVGV